MKKILIFFITLTSICLSQTGGGFLSGKVLNFNTNEPLAFCNVIIEPGSKFISTDLNGEFKIFLKSGKYTLKFSYMGFEAKSIQTEVSESFMVPLKIQLKTTTLVGDEVYISADRYKTTSSVEIINGKDVKNLPNIYSDPLRTIKVLPGVTSNNELTSAYNVRGGNYDENLIYLNGYEIYRPFLVRQGMEENQSIINRDLVKNMKFYSGAFSVELGDKMSSALEADYLLPESDTLHGVVQAGLLNSSATIYRVDGKVSYAAGLRYSYPNLFSSTLFTKGNYKPYFYDGQFLFSIPLSKKVTFEGFALYSRNEFKLTPESWTGYFQWSYLDVKAVSVEYTGDRNYFFKTVLGGGKIKAELSNNSSLVTQVSYYQTAEGEKIDLTGQIYFHDDANNLEESKRYLKTRYEFANNNLTLSNFGFKSYLTNVYKNFTFSGGVEATYSVMDNLVDESFYEKGTSSLAETPVKTFVQKRSDLYKIAGFAKGIYFITPDLVAELGLRYTYAGLSKSGDFSPRGGVIWTLTKASKVKFNTGLYCQQPFFYEIRDISYDSAKSLKSQKALHFVLGYDYAPNPKQKYSVELFYKFYTDLMPFDIDKLKVNYLASNSLEGFARGFDLFYEGEIVPGMNSRVAYSFLDSKERDVNGGEYHPRLLDQNHTINIFLQDRIPKHPEFQAHVRMLFGSGFLFHPRIIKTDPISGNKYLAVDYNSTEDYRFYLRFDMGLSNRFKIKDNLELMIVFEVLNIFNHNNVAYYSFYQVTPESTYPVRIPEIFSSRFFNASIEVRF